MRPNCACFELCLTTIWPQLIRKKEKKIVKTQRWNFVISHCYAQVTLSFCSAPKNAGSGLHCRSLRLILIGWQSKMCSARVQKVRNGLNLRSWCFFGLLFCIDCYIPLGLFEVITVCDWTKWRTRGVLRKPNFWSPHGVKRRCNMS